MNYKLLMNQSPEAISHYFFTMKVNGRIITSWGASSVGGTSGTVSRALYQPSERWIWEEEDGTTHREVGIESRSFYFCNTGGHGSSAADDGGLISVDIYRTRGQSRRAPVLEPLRSQERYGIV